MKPLPRPTRLLPAVACLLLAGCLGIGGGKGAPSRVFDLQPPAQATVQPPQPQQLAIGEPRAGQMLDSNRIAVRPTAAELQVYRGVSWRDPAPRLLHEALLRAFEDAGAFAAVTRVGSGMRGELLLLLDLRRFEAVYAAPGGPPQAQIELQATLLQGARGKALGSRRISATQPVAGTDAAEVVVALGQATATALDELVRWTHAQAAAADAAD
jgi:cholesterol transport system auxiliary component